MLKQIGAVVALSSLFLGGQAPLYAACVGKGGAPGEYVVTMESGGIDREYRVHVPPQYDPSVEMPLVFNFHGLGGTALGQEAGTGMSQKADEEGFIAVHPSGYFNSWNAGWCCGQAAVDQVDDVQFVRDMVARLTDEYCIDADRIYATGFSNGGFMTHRLACQASDIFAAFAPASAVIATSDCNPDRTIPLIQTHGTQDTTVPYRFGETSIEYWADHNQCTRATTTVYENDPAECVVYEGCANQTTLEFCTVRGMGHTWPDEDDGIDATDAFWDFFVAHPYPRSEAARVEDGNRPSSR